MHTIAFLNQKGGVGKTSTCFHLAGYFSQRFRVLLVDADPQASLTQIFWGPGPMEALAPDRTVAGLFTETDAPTVPAQLLQPSGYNQITLLPGSPALTEVNMRPRERWRLTGRYLSDCLEELSPRFAGTASPGVHRRSRR